MSSCTGWSLSAFGCKVTLSSPTSEGEEGAGPQQGACVCACVVCVCVCASMISMCVSSIALTQLLLQLVHWLLLLKDMGCLLLERLS